MLISLFNDANKNLNFNRDIKKSYLYFLSTISDFKFFSVLCFGFWNPTYKYNWKVKKGSGSLITRASQKSTLKIDSKIEFINLKK